MDEFPMAKSKGARALCAGVKQILIEVCNKDEPEAVRLINEVWGDRENIEDDPLLFEELPWFYAMAMAHGHKPQWWKEPGLWPPPEKWRNY